MPLLDWYLASRQPVHSRNLPRLQSADLVQASCEATNIALKFRSFISFWFTDIIDRCQPLPGSVDPTYGLSSVAICTQTNEAILRDGWRSFFSGHSSLSFAGLGFLSFYLAGKLHLFDRRGHTGKAWIALTPLAGASLVAISRSMDYRHHWHDIVVGSAVGLTLSYFSYRQYFPSLASPLSHLPYAPRIEREAESDEKLPTHHIPGDRMNPEAGGDVELVDGTVKRPGPSRLSGGWQEEGGEPSGE